MREQQKPEVTSVAITSATGIQNDLLNAGDIVTVTVTFDEIVIVNTSAGTRTPKLSLIIGSNPDNATYVSGSGTTELLFTYTIQQGENDDNGTSIGENAIDLDNSTIRDPSGNYATITHDLVKDNDSYMVDTTAPILDNVSVTSSTSETEFSEYSISDVCNGDCYIYVTAAFNERVTVTGNPRLTLVIGQGGTTVGRPLTYDNGTGSRSLVFKYAIQNDAQTSNDGDFRYYDGDGVNIDNSSELDLNGGTIKDLAGNEVTSLTFNDTGPNVSYKVK